MTKEGVPSASKLGAFTATAPAEYFWAGLDGGWWLKPILELLITFCECLWLPIYSTTITLLCLAVNHPWKTNKETFPVNWSVCLFPPLSSRKSSTSTRTARKWRFADWLLSLPEFTAARCLRKHPALTRYKLREEWPLSVSWTGICFVYLDLKWFWNVSGPRLHNKRRTRPCQLTASMYLLSPWDTYHGMGWILNS